ncbi:Acyl-CoA dehydrogenase [Companilactobacillus paralimentarius]
MAKAYGSRSAVKSGDDALQILGGYGYSLDYPVEHLIRDARAMEIAEGTVEKMRTAIALIEARNRA